MPLVRFFIPGGQDGDGRAAWLVGLPLDPGVSGSPCLVEYLEQYLEQCLEQYLEQLLTAAGQRVHERSTQ